MQKSLQKVYASGIICLEKQTRKRRCPFYSTNANNAENALTNWLKAIWTWLLVPIVAAKLNAIIPARCILQQGSKVKNVRAIVKIVRGANNF